MADIGMKCTQGQNLCLCWHLVFTVSVTHFGLSRGGIERHVSAMLTLRNCHIFTEACQSPQDTPVSVYGVNHASAFVGYKKLQEDTMIDWQIFISSPTPLTPNVFQPISFSKSDFLGDMVKKQFFGK